MTATALNNGLAIRRSLSFLIYLLLECDGVKLRKKAVCVGSLYLNPDGVGGLAIDGQGDVHHAGAAKRAGDGDVYLILAGEGALRSGVGGCDGDAADGGGDGSGVMAD